MMTAAMSCPKTVAAMTIPALTSGNADQADGDGEGAQQATAQPDPPVCPREFRRFSLPQHAKRGQDAQRDGPNDKGDQCAQHRGFNCRAKLGVQGILRRQSHPGQREQGDEQILQRWFLKPRPQWRAKDSTGFCARRFPVSVPGKRGTSEESRREKSMSAFRPVIAFLLERLTLALMGVAAALAAFIYLAHEVHAGETMRLDAAVFYYFQARQSPPLHALMAGISLLACGWVITGLSALSLLAGWRRPPARLGAVNFLLAAAGGQGVVYGLKALFHRARPEAVFASLGDSFPSGHAFAAVTIYGLLAYWLTRRGPGSAAWGSGSGPLA